MTGNMSYTRHCVAFHTLISANSHDNPMILTKMVVVVVAVVVCTLQIRKLGFKKVSRQDSFLQLVDELGLRTS
jgi:hypothetical protein